MAPSGKIRAQFVTNSSTETIYLDKFTANCTENQIYDRFANWTFSPVNFSQDLSCVSVSSCSFSMEEDPLNVTDGAQVKFSPLTDYLGNPMAAYDDVEYGGKIFAYCEEPGYIFDPQNITVFGEFVVRIVAECVPDQVEENLPGWLWAPAHPVTDEVVLPHMPWGTSIPPCG